MLQRADTGRMHPDGKIMELSGNVVARTRDADDPVAAEEDNDGTT